MRFLFFSFRAVSIMKCHFLRFPTSKRAKKEQNRKKIEKKSKKIDFWLEKWRT